MRDRRNATRYNTIVEAIYECRYCNYCGQAAIVEADNIPMSTGYGARIIVLINECGCDGAQIAPYHAIACNVCGRLDTDDDAIAQIRQPLRLALA